MSLPSGITTDPLELMKKSTKNPTDLAMTVLNPMFLTHKESVEAFQKAPETTGQKLPGELAAAEAAAATKKRAELEAQRKRASLIKTGGQGVTGTATVSRPSLLAG